MTYSSSRFRRGTISLSGRWRFVADPAASASFENGLPADSRWLPVPGCWNVEHGLMDYHGLGWYETHFLCGADRAILGFEGVSQRTRVWLDDRYLGEHLGGYLPFEFLVDLSANDEHRLVVSVDNRVPRELEPGRHSQGFDWYQYGGITRDVLLMPVPALHMQQSHILGHPDGRVEGKTLVRNAGRTTAGERLEVVIDGKVSHFDVEVSPGTESEVSWNVQLSQPVSWSPECPHLYEAVFRLGQDECRQRFGLRSLHVRGREILLNGRPIFLKGINRHDEHPDWGHAVPLQLAHRDLQMIKAAGCNALRGCHYPQSPAVLDLCDEMGLLFLAEIPAYQFSAEQMLKPFVRMHLLENLRGMIRRDFNHPCIVMWSILNECETGSDTPDGTLGRALGELFGEVKSLDSSRLVSYASAEGAADKFVGLADVVCVNEYLGWYRGKCSDIGEYLDSIAGAFPDKPIIITEFGAAAIEGYHSLERLKWSEEYQVDMLEKSVRTFFSRADLAGCFVWQFADVRVPESRAMSRPRMLNNKGLVSRYREPKSAYWVLRGLYGEGADLSRAWKEDEP